MKDKHTAEKQFITTHETAVYTFCHRMIGDAALADELAQAALVRAWAGGAHLEQPAVLREAWQLCRGRVGERPYPTTGGHGIPDLLAALPAAERAATILRHCLHLSEAASGAVLNLPSDDVRLTVRQARTRMAAVVLKLNPAASARPAGAHNLQLSLA